MKESFDSPNEETGGRLAQGGGENNDSQFAKEQTGGAENNQEKKEQWKKVYEGWDDFGLQLEEDGRKVYKIIEEIEMTESEKEIWGPNVTKKYRVGLGIEPDAVAQAERLIKGENEMFHPNCYKPKGDAGGKEWVIENSLSLYFFQHEKETDGGESERLKKPTEQLEEHNDGYRQGIVRDVENYIQRNITPEIAVSAPAALLAVKCVLEAVNNSGMARMFPAIEAVLVGTFAVLSYKEIKRRRNG